ncbi:synaptogyrin-2-like [Corticium candelabrum]|uniref:synaptogyrin-2-like n=1 Tax=Corticium candelabrum TaxID=121492 RepID=UPI002E2FFD8C|nr:synaptogyrin-2-like [Corticium candelabrum]
MRNRKSAATRIVLRLASLAFGVVVLACIADKLFVDGYYYYSKVCYFDLQNSACEFGLACGSLSLILSVVFCTLDCVAFVREIKNPTRQIISVTSGILDLVMAILWIACFGYLTRTWIVMAVYDFGTEIEGRVYATLAFSFLSIPMWIIMAVVDFRNRADVDASRTNQATTVCYPVNPPVYCPGYSPGNSVIVYHPAYPTQSGSCVIQPFVYPPGNPVDHPLAYPAFTMKQ